MAQESALSDPATMESQTQTSNMSMDQAVLPPIFTTERLIVRPYHPKDAPSMTLNANSPKTAQYMSNTFPNPYDLQAAKNWISMNVGQTHPAHFGIFHKSDPEACIGGIGLNHLSKDVFAHTAEIGYWIGEKHWGQGLMTEALDGMTKWSFESFEGKDGQRLRKLYGGIFSPNLGSMRCFEKNGFPLEGILKGHVEKNGKTLDLHMYGMTKPDWEAKQK
jgi:ribosomal-protein-alanine N-acetyltransferase